MADSKKRRLKSKSSETVRQRGAKNVEQTKQPRRLQRTASGIAKPFKAARQFGAREYYLPVPDNCFFSFLNKRRYVVPRYFRNSWQELKQVTWPSRRETWKLTLAVFTFAIIFGALIAVTDYGLDKVFRKVLIK